MIKYKGGDGSAKQKAIVILGSMNILYCNPSEDLLKTLEFL